MPATEAPPAPPVTARDIASWTPAQQLEALGHLARAVMARQREATVTVPAPTKFGGFVLAEVEEMKIRTLRDEELDPARRERARYAADPKNTIPFTDELLDRLIDEVPDRTSR